MLDPSWNKISKIEGPENLRNLKELYLSLKKITAIEGLENLRNLESLVLNKKIIKQVEGLKNLPNIKLISFYQNGLSGNNSKKSNIAKLLPPSAD